MQQIQQQINIFHTLFYVCLALCIVFLILSVIFFFKFDIRNIFNTKTGRSVRKTVQSMEEKMLIPGHSEDQWEEAIQGL